MKEECIICKAPLVYLEKDEMMECVLCHKKELSKTRCEQGHYVCNECHTKGMDVIIDIYSCLSTAAIDVNPHQVEAFTFSLAAMKLGGAVLADEVGLGKTIEAGLVLKYLLNSGSQKILLVMPSNLRKQWQVELDEKFEVESLIVESGNWDEYKSYVKNESAVVIVSYNFASRRKSEFAKVPWSFCVFDEAHRLRNVYKNGSKMASNLYELRDISIFLSYVQEIQSMTR